MGSHIALIVGRAGGPGGPQRPGDVLEVGKDVSAEEAERMVAGRQAREISKGEAPEKATAPSGEAAVAPKAKRRAKRSAKKK